MTWAIFITFPSLVAFVFAVCTLHPAMLTCAYSIQTCKMHAATFGNDCISEDDLEIERLLETHSSECERGSCALVQHGVSTTGCFVAGIT